MPRTRRRRVSLPYLLCMYIYIYIYTYHTQLLRARDNGEARTCREFRKGFLSPLCISARTTFTCASAAALFRQSSLPDTCSRASREVIPDNINPGSPDTTSQRAESLPPFLPLSLDLDCPTAAFYAKWRSRRSATQDCERVIKKSSGGNSPARSREAASVSSARRRRKRRKHEKPARRPPRPCRGGFIASGIYGEQWRTAFDYLGFVEMHISPRSSVRDSFNGTR